MLTGTFAVVQLESRMTPPVLVASVMINNEEVWSPSIRSGAFTDQQLNSREFFEQTPESSWSLVTLYSEDSHSSRGYWSYNAVRSKGEDLEVFEAIFGSMGW